MTSKMTAFPNGTSLNWNGEANLWRNMMAVSVQGSAMACNTYIPPPGYSTPHSIFNQVSAPWAITSISVAFSLSPQLVLEVADNGKIVLDQKGIADFHVKVSHPSYIIPTALDFLGSSYLMVPLAKLKNRLLHRATDRQLKIPIPS